MYSQIVPLILFGIATAFTPGPNNIMASYSGFNFGFRKTIPLMLGVIFGWTALLISMEVGLIFGAGMAADKPVEVLRFANRVPLMYQQGGCLLTKAIESVDWRQYGLEQAGGRGVPKGPAALLVHLASTNVQFTSEAKDFVLNKTRSARKV